MRVLFTTFGWPSHYFPMVPLAWACRAAGHEVLMTSQPELADLMRRSGLPYVTVGTDIDVVGRHRAEMAAAPAKPELKPPWEWDEERRRRVTRGMGLFVDLALVMASDLIAVSRAWQPDLVVHDPFTYAGPLAARVAGVPSVRNLFGLDISLDLELAALRPLLDQYGLTDLRIRGDLTLNPCPPSLQFPVSGQFPDTAATRNMRYVPYNGLSAVPGWLPQPPPRTRRVCLTWGTSTTRLGQDYTSWLPLLVDALRGLDVDVVVAVTAADRARLGEAGDRVRVAELVPLQALLPGCAAVVHQGGAGTTLTSLLHGLPQLVIAQIADQVVNASRIADTGAGRYLVGPEASVDVIRDAVTRILDDPGYRDAASGLQAEMLAQDTPAAVVPVLEDLAACG
jgi:UDP:flavonoid glycosyltransferase YjiC (YdhE family)